MSHTLPDGFVKDVVGYCDPLSVRPGDDVRFMISSYDPGTARIEVVHLISGDDRPHGTGLIETPVSCSLDDEVELQHQPLILGSYATVPDMPALAAAEVSFWFYPTLPGEAWRTLLNCAGTLIATNVHGVRVSHQGQTLDVALAIEPRRWHQVTLRLADDLELVVARQRGGMAEQGVSAAGAIPNSAGINGGEWTLAATSRGVDHFNGRLEAPIVRTGDEVIAAWDFSQAMASQTIRDTGSHARHGTLHQNPTRGVCGRTWDGSVQSYHDDPSQYGAIHFHEAFD